MSRAHRSLFTFAFLQALLLFGSCDDPNTAIQPDPVILPEPHARPEWSAQGDSIYFIDHGVTRINAGGGYNVDPDSIGLRIVASSGGNPRTVAKGFDLQYAFAPEDSAVCMAQFGGDLYAASFARRTVAPGDFRRITSIGGIYFPSWSPTGEWIAFDTSYNDPRGAGAVWKVKPDGTGLTDISVHGRGEWRGPSWSPSGDRIAYFRYVSSGTSASEIFVMNADGTNSKRLTRNDVMDIGPHFSPDGKRICYETYEAGPPGICVINADGSGFRRLANGEYPAWSPVSDEIAFVAYTNVPATHGTIRVIHADGTGLRQITRSRLK